ncbi:MAG: 5-carboxymethyl-2-hydroxymuconate semialdehyde dehydrogenase [Pseudomonadota bacterium]|jgi:5-carboxymethyl-2-hydroxymuconic-semialdehyde dehydrogenase
MNKPLANDALTDNLRKASQFLARFKNEVVPHRIAGEAVIGKDTFDNLDPSDNSVIGRVASGGAAEVDKAARAAEAAFQVWKTVPGEKRRALLHTIADRIEKRSEEIALVESVDSGQPIRYMSKAALRGAENFRFYADKAPEANDGTSLPTETHLNYTIRQPIGPVGVITPWNTPFMLSTWKIAPALAAGCTIVHKPAEWSPLSAVILSEIMSEVFEGAGLPKGVVNLVHGFGESAGKALTEHPAIKALAFVGETVTGSHIMAQGAPTLKRVHFELGGKNPVIVFDDADLDRALDAALFMIYSLNGQRCTSSSRALVQRSIYDTFTAKLKARVEKIKVGHPLDPDTEIGPLIHSRHVEKVLSYADHAKKDGAQIAFGGQRALDGKGNFVSPTLFTGAANSMRIAQEEIFGPVLTAIPFDDEADALRIANDVRYGLAAYIWTGSVGRAHRVAQSVEAGMVWVNSENVRHLPTPFGGVKSSGIGRDGGEYAFEVYMEHKNIAIGLDRHKPPKIGV